MTERLSDALSRRSFADFRPLIAGLQSEGASCRLNHSPDRSIIRSPDAALPESPKVTMTPPLREAVRAAQDRKALDLDVLDLKEVSAFTDFFLICSGTSTRHTQAICDAIVDQLEKSGISPAHIEGYAQAEWILVDYLHFVVHVFSQRARQFYDLERLWRNAQRLPIVNGEL